MRQRKDESLCSETRKGEGGKVCCVAVVVRYFRADTDRLDFQELLWRKKHSTYQLNQPGPRIAGQHYTPVVWWLRMIGGKKVSATMLESELTSKCSTCV